MKSDRFNRFVLVGAAVGGAICGGVFGYLLNKGVVINGRGLLARAVWPLNTPVPFALVGAVLAAISVIRANRREQSLRAELHEVARMLGLAYDEDELEEFPGLHPRKLFRQKWGSYRNRLSGTSDGVPAHMFDLTTMTLSSSPDNVEWTAVLFQQTHLPAFACIPNSWLIAGLMPSVSFDPEVGDQMAHQAVADFQKAYHLSLPEKAVRSDEDEVRRLFRPPRLEALARCPGWHVESTGSCLVFARDGTARAADRPALWREAIELRRALLAPVSSAVMPFPVAPGMERDRQSNRQSGRSWGCLTGAVVGVFGSSIALMSVMFNWKGAPGQFPFLALFPVVVIGGLAVGALAGRVLGGRLAARFYRPTPDGALAPKIKIDQAWGWIIAGSFAGLTLGGAIMMGLVTVLRQFPLHWVMPIVCLSPPVLCLVLGGFAGYRVARRRAARRTGA